MRNNEAPRWETAVLCGSFVLIWVWFLARQNAYRTQVDLHWSWYLILLGAVAVLIAVFVRRLRRTLAALRGEHPARGGRPDRN